MTELRGLGIRINHRFIGPHSQQIRPYGSEIIFLIKRFLLKARQHVFHGLFVD